MNAKITLGILTILVIVSAFLLLNNTGTQQSTAQPTIQPTPTQPVAIPTPQEMISTETTVEVTSSGFSPITLTVKRGKKVIWVNKTDRVVTVHSNPHPIHINYRPLNLGQFNPNATVELIFEKTGTYMYHNHLDPSMTGTIVVE